MPGTRTNDLFSASLLLLVSTPPRGRGERRGVCEGEGEDPSENTALPLTCQELDAQEKRFQLGQRRALHLRGYHDAATQMAFRCRPAFAKVCSCQSPRGLAFDHCPMMSGGARNEKRK